MAPALLTESPTVPASNWTCSIHPLHEQVIKEVDGYFLQNWPFPDEKSRKKFVAAGFSRVTCFYFPEAFDDRIHFACRLLTLLFLIDDLLEFMSLEDGKAYNEKLMPITRGEVLPDRSKPVEWITYDLWESMRAHDRAMADDIQEPVFIFMRAQTDKKRLEKMDLGSYLEYREADVGRALLGALMRFSMALKLSPEDQSWLRPADRICSKHLSIVNDIWSFEKEALIASNGHKEGAILCNAVDILARETEIPANSSKNVLYHLCREWENIYEAQTQELLDKKDTPVIRAYLKGLRYQMSGNERWSATTLRYLAPKD
ncbi:Aristolochene synthase in complex with 12,13-Difluorofarnesyl diphosphate [Astrocystis sublimbata]|nr:Aristolochene synthase in complex with 12,13-Difluorofarnesyl diphosphate [Astrocystis sublimbata]